MQIVAYALVSASGRRVVVRATGGGCTLTAHLTAIETTSQVRLRLAGYDDDRPNVACPANLILWTRSVTLSKPLGARRLIDDSRGKPISSFDGKRLAKAGWLPDGLSGVANRPDGAGWWARIYTFDKAAEAPIEIDQLTGDRRGLGELTDAGYVRRTVEVHGQPGVLVEQREPNEPLLQDRLAWYEDGSTYIVESSPDFDRQRPFPPATLFRVANALTLARG